MKKEEIAKALLESRAFKIGNSFIFTLQIPNDSTSSSFGSCVNCGKETAYCHQICELCGLPFIGPFGFPKISIWKTLSQQEKRVLVEDIYCHSNNRGRLGYVNVQFVPLSSGELSVIEKMKDDNARLFLSAYGIDPLKIREKFLV